VEISKKQKILGYKIRIKVKSASDEKLNTIHDRRCYITT